MRESDHPSAAPRGSRGERPLGPTAGAAQAEAEQRAGDDRGAELMLAFQAGDERAFDALVELFAGHVWALLTRFLGAAPEREDLVQEVFLRVLRARRSYRPTARFSTWLYRIAFNLAANHRERAPKKRHLRLERAGPDGEPLDVADASAPSPSQSLEREDVVDAVRAAIAELPDAQRMALVLARYEELPFAEIARVLDTSESAVKSLVHRAREFLRERLRPYFQEELA
jgi:RNA polymerase sigma-70 factor (ECF subfamily)